MLQTTPKSSCQIRKSFTDLPIWGDGTKNGGTEKTKMGQQLLWENQDFFRNPSQKCSMRCAQKLLAIQALVACASGLARSSKIVFVNSNQSVAGGRSFGMANQMAGKIPKTKSREHSEQNLKPSQKQLRLLKNLLHLPQKLQDGHFGYAEHGYDVGSA